MQTIPVEIMTPFRQQQDECFQQRLRNCSKYYPHLLMSNLVSTHIAHVVQYYYYTTIYNLQTFSDDTESEAPVCILCYIRNYIMHLTGPVTVALMVVSLYTLPGYSYGHGLGSKPSAGRIICVRITAVYALGLKSRAGTEGSTVL